MSSVLLAICPFLCECRILRLKVQPRLEGIMNALGRYVKMKEIALHAKKKARL